MAKRLLCFLVLCFLVCSCSEPEPWPNSRRYQSAQTEVVYQAPENVAESIEAAWHPSSILSISDEELIYADAATRRIVQLNTKTGQQKALFDFSELEYSYKASFPYQVNWGTALIRVDDNWCILADSRSSMIWFNLQTGQVELVGNIHPENAFIPADGVALKDVDFELFSGLGVSKSGFYMVFANGIFHVPWNGQSPSTLLNAPMEHIAGSFDKHETSAPTDAKSVVLKLSINTFTHLLEHNGWLYFWEYRTLRAVKDGFLVTITGDGYTSPDCSLDEFYAQSLSLIPQLIRYQDHFYTSYRSDNSALLEIHIDAIDVTSERAQGHVSILFPEAGSIGALALSSSGLLSADHSAGSFWHVSNDDSIPSRRIFGPESSESKEDSFFNDENSPYHPHEILGPLAINLMHDGEIALVYSPTHELLSALELASNSSLSLWKNNFTHIITDNKTRAWLANTGSMSLYQLTIDDNGKIHFAYNMRFFNEAEFMGIPCKRDVLSLPEVPELSAFSDGVLLYNRDTQVILSWNQEKDLVMELHDNGSHDPSEMTGSKHYGSLRTPLLEYWASRKGLEASLLRENERQYLLMTNLTSRKQNYADTAIGSTRVVKLAGSGSKTLGNDVRLEDSYMDGVTAMTMDDEGLVVVASQNVLYKASANGTWQSMAEQCPLPENGSFPEQLVMHGYGKSQQCIVKKDGVYRAYSQKQTQLANTAIDSSWPVVKVEWISSCTDTLMAYIQNRKLCVENTRLNVKRCTGIPKDFIVSSLACSEKNIYLSGSLDGSPVVYFSELGMPETLGLWGGNGDGLPLEASIKDATLGQKLGGWGMDGIPNLYFWMKDTCSIWKLPVYYKQEMNADMRVYRMMTDEKLCHADAFAVSFDSTTAMIHEDTLYRIEGREFVPLAQVKGEVIEMIAMGYGYVIMTTEGIYTWENGRLIHKHGSKVRIGNEIIHYAIPGGVHPRMVQSPNENAVLVPVFSGDRIIKIAL